MFGLRADAGVTKVTELHKLAYDQIFNLEFDKAKVTISDIAKNYPDDLMQYQLENYIDFLTIFINEDKPEFKRLEVNKSKRLTKVKAGNPDDPYFLFCQAEITLHWAMARVLFEEYAKAVYEVNRAIGLLEKNSKKFPDFISNKKSLSILNAISGAIPDSYKGIVSALSRMDGTVDQGIAEIEEVIRRTDSEYLFYNEAIAIKALIYLHLKEETEIAWQTLEGSEIDFYESPIANYLKANVAMHIDKNDEAIDILTKRKRSSTAYPFYYLNLVMGKAKLRRLDSDAAIYLQAYINSYGGSSYIKSAYQKLAWYALIINNDASGYRAYIDQCKRSGNKRIDDDNTAHKEALSGKFPNPDLLKSRLLFDGGYLESALQVLDEMDDFKLDQDENIEKIYRKARILHRQGNTSQALSSYSECIKKGKSNPLYFACNSALQIGNIYESQKNYKEARKYYDLCLDIKPSTHKKSIHREAKAGLKRIK